MNFKNSRILFIFIVSVFYSNTYSQNFNIKNIFNDICFTASLTYVSSATIMLNPVSADIVEKNSTVDLTKGGYGYGFSLKKKIFSDDIYIGISTEYIKISDDQLSMLLENEFEFERVRVTETVEMIPFEVSLYFNIPRVVDNLNVYLGGGGGFYFGNRTRAMLKMETQTVSKKPMFSLNVLFGAEYLLDKHFSMNFEMKVRDGKFKVQNHFPVNHVVLNGQTYYFEQDFESKIFIDGVKMNFGIGYYF